MRRKQLVKKKICLSSPSKICFEINFQQILPDGCYDIPEVPPPHRFFTNKNITISVPLFKKLWGIIFFWDDHFMSH